MSRYFLLRLSRFLAFFNIDDETIDDETFKDVSDDEVIEDVSDDEALRDSRTRILRRDFRLFFYLNRCLIHCLNQKLERKL